MYYPAVFIPHKVDGHIVYDVTFPDVPGCYSQGGSLEEALIHAGEALLCHLEDDGEWPAASSLSECRRKGREESESQGTPWPSGVEVLLVPVEQVSEPARQEPVKFSVSLQPVVLNKLEDIRRELGVTRSGAIAAAAVHYHRYIKALDR